MYFFREAALISTGSGFSKYAADAAGRTGAELMLYKFSEGKPYKVIALCLTRFKAYDQVKIIKELCGRCDGAGIKVMIFSTVTDLYNGGINDIGESRIFSSFEPERFDAVVVMSETFKNFKVLNKLVTRAQGAGVPVISIDRVIEGCINITFDYSNSFEQLVRHVVEYHKVKLVNMMAGYRDNPFSEERIQCFKKVLRENNIEVDERRILYGDFWAEPARAALEEFMESGLEMPQAIVCANDIMAIECMRTLKEHGYRIPEDIIVTGFDGIDLEQYYSPRLTTAEYRIEDLGDSIIQAVMDNVDGRTNKEPRVVKYINRTGGSCGCVQTATEDVEERLYKEKFITDDREEFIQFMYNMIAQLSNYPDLHYIFRMIPEHVDRIGLKELWMCFNSDFLDENMNVSFDFNRNAQNNIRYTDVMKVPLHIRNGEICEDADYQYTLSDLLPDMENILQKNDYILFVPTHLQGAAVGYMAATFDADKFFFTYYQTFLLDFRHILEVYVNRSTTERLYISDVLTQIYNRHGFYRNIGEIMRRSQRTGEVFTIISLDMDGLKKINDTYGHAEGDFALKKIGEIMRSVTVKGEICARFGGDEFIIAFSSMDGEKRAAEIVDSIRSGLLDFNSFGTKPYYINVSIGVYSKTAEKTDTLDTFIKYADDRMYENKKENKKKEEGIQV